MIRVVLDTNILVSAAISRNGHCARIVQAVLGGTIQAVVAPGIQAEYLDVLHRGKFTRYALPPPWLDRFLRLAEHLPADPVDLPPCPDPDDRLFLGVAQETGLLVTGNLRHFPREAWGLARVLAPGAFLAEDASGPI